MLRITGRIEDEQPQMSSQIEMRVYEKDDFNEMVSERSGVEIFLN